MEERERKGEEREGENERGENRIPYIRKIWRGLAVAGILMFILINNY